MKSIVIIDSGLGGLPYLARLQERLTHHRLVYIADTANFPYGTKTHQQLRVVFEHFLPKIAHFQPSALLIACNTASLHGGDFFKNHLTIPIITTRPSLSLAYQSSSQKRIAVLATAASLSSSALSKLLTPYPVGVFIPMPATSLVAFVEEDLVDSSPQQQYFAIKPYFDAIMKEGCDTVVLGCTHFVHLKQVMALHYPNLNIIDNSIAVADEVVDTLKLNHPAQDNQPAVAMLYQTSNDHQQQYKKMATRFNLQYQGII